MTPTITQIQNWFNDFNTNVFKGQLSRIPIKITNNRRQLGQFYWGENGIGIKVSTYYDMPEDMFRNIVLHEMCHYYCYYQGLYDEHHGKNWQAIASYATKVTGLQIARCADIRGIKPAKKNEEKHASVVAKKNAPAIIVDLGYDDHHFVVKVTKNVIKRETNYDWKFNTSAKTADVYISDDPKFRGFQTSRSIRRGYKYLPKEYDVVMRPRLEKAIKVDDLRDLCWMGKYDCLGIN